MQLSEELEIELQQTVTLPEEIEVISFLGKGRRSFAYKGKYDNQDCVIKIYRKEFVEKYLNKYNVDIAEFECKRNSMLYGINTLKPYIARPFRVFARTSSFTHSFVQQYIHGVTLDQLISRLGYLPEAVLKAGYKIVRTAELSGIHDMDISVGNVMATNKKGIWTPVLYDFNMLPQHMAPPNFLITLCLKAGLRRKSYRDYRSLKNWERRGRHKRWLGKS